MHDCISERGRFSILSFNTFNTPWIENIPHVHIIKHHLEQKCQPQATEFSIGENYHVEARTLSSLSPSSSLSSMSSRYRCPSLAACKSATSWWQWRRPCWDRSCSIPPWCSSRGLQAASDPQSPQTSWTTARPGLSESPQPDQRKVRKILGENLTAHLGLADLLS